MSFQDQALANAFPTALQASITRGASSQQVVAVQYALGRLGHLQDLCDGKFGKNTQAAVLNFQKSVGMPASAQVDQAMLQLLDQQLQGLDLRAPAVKSSDPLAYLSNFFALGMPEIKIQGTQEFFSWDSTEIQRAYGEFVANYWQVMKRNKVEADCKGLALFFLDQFRKQLKFDRLIDLPDPTPRGRNNAWIVATRQKTHNFFDRADNSGGGVRGEYSALKQVEHLDPEHSMLYGVAVHFPMISAAQVARASQRVQLGFSNQGNMKQPEVAVNQLRPGHLIFIDHTGNGTYDHTVNVVSVEQDGVGRTRKLVLAVGSFDHVRDADSDTAPNGLREVNTYAEEVVVALDKQGFVVKDEVSWSSEPSYIVRPRYNAANTLMEKKAGGRLFVGRWG